MSVQSNVKSPVVYVYLPYVDDLATGMQRFGSQMILALLRAGIDARIVIGEVQARPPWLESIQHQTIIGARLARLLPRALHPLWRVLWLQFVLPVRAGRHAVLVALAQELAPFPRVRQVAVAHDLTYLKAFSGRRSAPERIRHRVWLAGIQRSGAVIAISEATKCDLVDSLGVSPDGVTVVHEGYDPAVFQPPGGSAALPAVRRPFLLYAGTLAANKNISFLLNVYARVRERVDVDLTLVGSQPAAQVAALMAGVAEQAACGISFAGFVEDQQLAALMQTCAAFVFPSLNEGFGLAPVEAMACGAPVISSDAGSLREVIGGGGVLLSPIDSDLWVEAVTRVLRDDEHRHDLSQRALARSADFSWDRAAKIYGMVIAGL